MKEEDFRLHFDAIKGVYPHSVIQNNTDSVIQYVEHFNYHRLDFEINTELRAAAFIAQTFAESNYGRRLEENLNYSAERLMQVWPTRFHGMYIARAYDHKPMLIANRVYGGRMGNREPGDGWRYRGRGYMMLTGRNNYEKFFSFAIENYACNPIPDDLLHPSWAMLSAMWYWKDRELNRYADVGDIDEITRLITGCKNDAPSRKRLYLKLLQMFANYKK